MHPLPPAPAPPRPDAGTIAALIATLHEQAQRAHPGLALALPEFSREVRARLDRRRGAVVLSAHPGWDEQALKALAAEDLYLAIACDQQLNGAWERFHRLYRPRLLGLARSRGLQAQAADELCQDLLGELVLPPPRSGTRTRMGAFLGAGSLFGWLALILSRRIGACFARASTPSELATEAGLGPDPVEQAGEAELAVAVASALCTAFSLLTARERLMLVWKHLDHVPQKEIAARLGIGEPRVSRIVAAALAQLRAAAVGEGKGAGGLPTGVEPRRLLGEALRVQLAIEAGGVTPPRADLATGRVQPGRTPGTRRRGEG